MATDRMFCLLMYAIALLAAVYGKDAVAVVVAIFGGALRISFAIEKRS